MGCFSIEAKFWWCSSLQASPNMCVLDLFILMFKTCSEPSATVRRPASLLPAGVPRQRERQGGGHDARCAGGHPGAQPPRLARYGAGGHARRRLLAGPAGQGAERTTAGPGHAQTWSKRAVCVSRQGYMRGVAHRLASASSVRFRGGRGEGKPPCSVCRPTEYVLSWVATSRGSEEVPPPLISLASSFHCTCYCSFSLLVCRGTWWSTWRTRARTRRAQTPCPEGRRPP